MLLRPVLMPILRNPLQGIADGIRNMLAELLGSSQFFAPLTHSLVLARGTGSPTFTRADATNCATFRDWEGWLRTVPSGCARFEGARMVRNLIVTSSEDIPNYSNNNTTVAASSVEISRVTSVYDIYETAATGIHTRNRLFPALAGHKYACSVRAKAGTLRRVMIRDGAVTGSASTFDLVSGTVVADEAGGVGTIQTTENSGVYLLTMTFTAPSDGNYSPYIYLMRDGTAGNGSASYAGDISKYLTAGGVQIEDVTGQADQTASEYVSVGVPSDWAGTDLVTNGTFDTVTTGWLPHNSAALSVVSGKLRVAYDVAINPGGYQAITTVAGQKYVLSVDPTYSTLPYVASASAIGPGNADLYNPGVLTVSQKTIGEFTATTTTTYITMLGVGASGYVDFDNISVKPAAYHGAGVDGVEFFNTDRDGAVIPAATNTGYLAEGARTNLCAYSQSIAAGFTFTGTCTGTDNVGTYAGIPFTRINNATGGASYIPCSYTGDGTKAFSVLLKKDAAVTGTYSVGFYDSTAAATRGYVTATIAGDGSMTFAAFGGCTVTSSEILADGVYYLKGTVAGIVAANTNTYYANFAVGTATSCLVSAMQTEDGSSASSYIATTTAAVTRAADVLTYPSAGNISGTVGAAYAEASTVWSSGTSVYNQLVGSYTTAVGALLSRGGVPTEIVIRDGTGVVAATGLPTMYGVPRKLSSNWSGSTSLITGSGATPTSGAFDGDMGFTSIPIGCSSLSDAQWYGTIRNVRIWQRALSASEMQAITA